MSNYLWKAFIFPATMWLWTSMFTRGKYVTYNQAVQYAENEKPMIKLYATLCWIVTVISIMIFSIAPIYGYIACFLIIIWHATNAIYAISKWAGELVVTLFWLSIFVGVFFFLSPSAGYIKIPTSLL
tara:strand:- start:21220 stop:21600 length:381 start_codon:yes stop_codon:yes gene_type:complete